MPTTYAHYTFGKEVLKRLNEELRVSINNNIDLYNIGLHGPDILFYYKPLQSNKVNKLGNEIHKINSDIFFEQAKEKILSCDDFNKAFAYIAGFICHFMLDSQCHPYIRQKESQISHNEIETEFDRAIMLKDSLNPITFKPTSHIIPSMDNAKCISQFFYDTTPEEIFKALKSMKLYLDLLVAPKPVPRALLIWALKISGSNNKIDLIKKYSPNEKCNKINHELIELYNDAIKPCALLIEEYIEKIKTEDKINERFKRNFG
jgi:hypothetical protein